MRYFLKAVKNAGVFTILLCFACFRCRAEDYSLSFLQIDGGFEFFAMQSSETGHVGVLFGKQQKPYLLPEPKISVTLGMDSFGSTSRVSHVCCAFGLVVFEINELFFKIESDRTVTLWGGNADDRVFIYNKNNLNLRLVRENFNGSVFYRLNDEEFKKISVKPFNK